MREYVTGTQAGRAVVLPKALADARSPPKRQSHTATSTALPGCDDSGVGGGRDGGRHGGGGTSSAARSAGEAGSAPAPPHGYASLLELALLREQAVARARLLSCQCDRLAAERDGVEVLLAQLARQRDAASAEAERLLSDEAAARRALDRDQAGPGAATAGFVTGSNAEAVAPPAAEAAAAPPAPPREPPAAAHATAAAETAVVNRDDSVSGTAADAVRVIGSRPRATSGRARAAAHSWAETSGGVFEGLCKVCAFTGATVLLAGVMYGLLVFFMSTGPMGYALVMWCISLLCWMT